MKILAKTSKKPVKASVDYSQLSEAILIDQIKQDLKKVQRYADKTLAAVEAGTRSYDLFLMMKADVERIEDCYHALHSKKRGRRR